MTFPNGQYRTLHSNNLEDNCKNSVTNAADKWHLTIVNISQLQNVKPKCEYDVTEPNNRPKKSLTGHGVRHIERTVRSLYFLSWTTVKHILILDARMNPLVVDGEIVQEIMWISIPSI